MDSNDKLTSKLPKPVKVSPTVTDPNMQTNTKALLEELGAEDDETEALRKTMFNSKYKTKEETNKEEPVQGTNTLLIIVFALIVVALVALVVWMVMKQNETKKNEEDDMRARLHPHQRNALPRQISQQQLNAYKQAQARAQAHARAQAQAQEHARHTQMQDQTQDGDQTQDREQDRDQALQHQAHARAQVQAQLYAKSKAQKKEEREENDGEHLKREDATPENKDDHQNKSASPEQDSSVSQQQNNTEKTTKKDLDNLLEKTNLMMTETDGLNDTDRNMLEKLAQENHDRNTEDDAN